MFNLRYVYDALGNLIYHQLPNGENQYYQYDLENQLVRAEIKKPVGNTDQDSYKPLAQVFHNNQDETQYLAYFHND